MYPKGTKLLSRSGKPLYEKLDSLNFGLWVSLTSTHAVEIAKGEYEVISEELKPLYKADGSLNRFGWKWADEQVYNEYSGRYMIIPPPNEHKGYTAEFSYSNGIFWSQVTTTNGDILLSKGDSYSAAWREIIAEIEFYVRYLQKKFG